MRERQFPLFLSAENIANFFQAIHKRNMMKSSVLRRSFFKGVFDEKEEGAVYIYHGKKDVG